MNIIFPKFLGIVFTLRKFNHKSKTFSRFEFKLHKLIHEQYVLNFYWKLGCPRKAPNLFEDFRNFISVFRALVKSTACWSN